MEIVLREYQAKDFKALANIIRETWHYDDFCRPKTAAKLANVFLSSCLTNYTFSRVALLDGEPIGIILANDKAEHRFSLRRKWKQIRAIVALFLSAEGRRVSEIFKDVNGIDQVLLEECGENYPAELTLFAVKASVRGQGVGKRLFQEALNYMEERKLERFYLFTDTSCNYGFYEHQGMVRRCSKAHLFKVKGQQAKMNFFIYDYVCR